MGPKANGGECSPRIEREIRHALLARQVLCFALSVWQGCILQD